MAEKKQIQKETLSVCLLTSEEKLSFFVLLMFIALVKPGLTA